MSIKVFKNVFQTICALIGIAIVDICLLAGYIASLFAEQPNYGWIALVAAGALLCLFFICGFYWVFQRVIIDENGIRIILFGKTLKKCNFDEIESYTITSVMRNPAIKIHLKNSEFINIDRRKAALKCLEFYGVEQDNASKKQF